MILLILGGAVSGPPSLVVILIFWPFVAFVLKCVTAYWDIKDEEEERRLHNRQTVDEVGDDEPPPDSEEYQPALMPLKCPLCGSTNASWSLEYEAILCYDCRIDVHESQDDEELTDLLRQFQAKNEGSRSDDAHEDKPKREGSRLDDGKSLPQLRLEDIKDTPPLSHEELMNSLLRFRVREKKH
jgi:hypothetical protein